MLLLQILSGVYDTDRSRSRRSDAVEHVHQCQRRASICTSIKRTSEARNVSVTENIVSANSYVTYLLMYVQWSAGVRWQVVRDVFPLVKVRW